MESSRRPAATPAGPGDGRRGGAARPARQRLPGRPGRAGRAPWRRQPAPDPLARRAPAEPGAGRGPPGAARPARTRPADRARRAVGAADRLQRFQRLRQGLGRHQGRRLAPGRTPRPAQRPAATAPVRLRTVLRRCPPRAAHPAGAQRRVLRPVPARPMPPRIRPVAGQPPDFRHGRRLPGGPAFPAHFRKTRMIDYIRDGQAIYRQSFATIRAEANLAGIPADLEKLAVRVIHACGMVDVVDDLRFSPGAGAAGRAALAAGAAILCDARMVAEGVTRSRLPAANRVICTLNEADVPALATELGNTRSAVALEHWREHLEGSVVVIGNAPTALFYLLEMLDAGAPKPALILGFPVGFVGAAESKEMLAADSRGVPYVIVRGRRGGSAMAAAAVNALATERE
ncbi:Precorrin-8X methylmutase [Pseudomonas aeruginosa MH27]|nr:Precorrin-8X methylmutase [Pseudomonas aeruginosa MH27]